MVVLCPEKDGHRSLVLIQCCIVMGDERSKNKADEYVCVCLHVVREFLENIKSVL